MNEKNIGIGRLTHWTGIDFAVLDQEVASRIISATGRQNLFRDEILKSMKKTAPGEGFKIGPIVDSGMFTAERLATYVVSSARQSQIKAGWRENASPEGTTRTAVLAEVERVDGALYVNIVRRDWKAEQEE